MKSDSLPSSTDFFNLLDRNRRGRTTLWSKVRNLGILRSICFLLLEHLQTLSKTEKDRARLFHNLLF
ncbi:MAG: hypothetical protein ACTSYM_02645 [Candidatus Baldrarchaeia archaeon]